jgi:hypothetical protein
MGNPGRSASLLRMTACSESGKLLEDTKTSQLDGQVVGERMLQESRLCVARIQAWRALWQEIFAGGIE